ncbi:MAG: NAD-dependent epimerase/dehydratase family protein [Planctomycetota bacterium]
MRILVTGAAGFIGFHTTRELISRGHVVVGLDSLNDYYDIKLKHARLNELKKLEDFEFAHLNLADRSATEDFFGANEFDRVIHLAAQPGVRYSIENPHAYIESNIVAFMNVLEGCRSIDCPHLVYASSSSVYGNTRTVPFEESTSVNSPVSMYAATKISNELMASVYSNLHGMATTGLRFFTVYGPWGRPDMAYWMFTESILKDRPIKVFNEGQLRRDFTYIDDIVEGIIRLSEKPINFDTNIESKAQVFNIGNHSPVPLMEFIETLEETLGKKAVKTMLPMQPGDVLETYADVSKLQKVVDFKPTTSLKVGLQKFSDWYLNTYQQKIDTPPSAIETAKVN